MKQIKCRACGEKITKFFSLGKMPLVNSFLKKKEIAGEKKYDLTVGFCPVCYLVQITETVPPRKLFNDYLYFSSTSKSFLEHCERTARELIKRFKLGKKSLVIEIASNDGAQLQYFKKMGAGILGIDPAKNIAAVANKKGIKTIPEFFNSNLAKKLRKKGIAADLVFGANVLAHVPGIVDFTKGVEIILKPKGTAIFEFPYIKGLMENKFDTIYHEHVFYYSLIALKNLFARAGLMIYDVEMTPTQGGSLRIFISRPGSFPVSGSVKKLIREEMRNGFDRIATYRKINNNVRQLKKRLIALLGKIKKEGKTVAAYSAPAKGNILLNYFGVNKNYLDFIVDKAKEKQGLYTPGAHLVVYPPEKIFEEKPDYLLVLCWNLADEVVKQLKGYRRQGGKLIVPVPQVKIL